VHSVETGRPCASGWLLKFSRATFAASFLLIMLTPAWERGTFNVLPIVRFRLSGQDFQVGALALLPAVATITWALAYLRERPGCPSCRAAVSLAPMLLFCTLALVRIWPVHIRHRAAVTVVAVLIAGGTCLYVMQEGSERWCAGLLTALLLLQGGAAVVQFVKQGSIGLSWMGELWLDPDGQGISVIDVAGRRWLRAYGLTSHPNALGGYLSMGILACLGAVRAVPSSTRRWTWGAILLGSMGLFFTFSRSAWLGTAVGLLYLAWVMRPWRAVDWRAPRVRRAALLLGGLLAVVATVLGVAYRDLLATRLLRLGDPLEATSIRERAEDYPQAWGLIRVAPLQGVGSGYYVDALWAGVGADRPPGFRKVHNIYLLAAAELGIGGALLWLGIVLAPSAVLACRALRTGGAAIGAGWAAALLSAAVLGVFDNYLYIPSTWWPALYLGLLAGAWARVEDHRE